METLYRCEHCYEVFGQPSDCVMHELHDCVYNPNLKSCETCNNSKKFFDTVCEVFGCIKGLKDDNNNSKIIKYIRKRNCEHWEGKL